MDGEDMQQCELGQDRQWGEACWTLGWAHGDEQNSGGGDDGMTCCVLAKLFHACIMVACKVHGLHATINDAGA